VTNKSKSALFGRKSVLGGSSEESELSEVQAASTTRESQRVQWAFRRRDSSDRSSQPYSAPSGSFAQQSENFQRFYRAVVSPTHVRVTAGGRIVPNNRAIASPQFEWNGEQSNFDPRNSFSDTELNLQAAPLLQNTTLESDFPQISPAGLASTYNTKSQNCSLGFENMSSQNLGNSLGNDRNLALSGNAIKLNGEIAAAPMQSHSLPQPIKLSNPNLFDQSKPFLLNGQWVNPLPPGFQPPLHALPIPYSLVGNPNLVPANVPVPPATLFSQLPMPMGFLASPLLGPTLSQPPAVPIRNTIGALEHVPPFATLFPTPSVLSLPDITRHQIEGYRAQLKLIENQIANNKHQIDVDYMEHQRSKVESLIEQMEAILDFQLAHQHSQDTGQYTSSSAQIMSGSQSSGESRQRINRPNGISSSLIPKGDSSLGLGIAHINTKTDIATMASAKQKPRDENIQGTENADETKLPTRPETAAKSRLTAAAAKAPPFRPRTQAMLAHNLSQFTHNFADKSSTDVQVHDGDQVVLQSSLDWGQSTYPQFATGIGHASLSRAHTVHDTPTYTQQEFPPPNLQRFHTIHGQHAPFQASVPLISPHAVPYLVGTLPQGFKRSEIQASDLVYPRPLTEDELRARYLYWGKAPRSALNGLPKFDGKDFYPPSPAKNTAPVPSYSPVISSSVDRLRTPVPIDLETLFTAPEKAGHKTTSPDRPSIDPPSFTTPKQSSLKDTITGYETPSSKPTTYKFDASSYRRASPKQSSRTTKQSTVDENLSATPSEDFSKLFLERGVPGYKSPSPSLPGRGKSETQPKEKIEVLATLTKKRSSAGGRYEEDDTETVNSWKAPLNHENWGSEDTELVTSSVSKLGGDDSAGNADIPTINLKRGSPKRRYGTSFLDRASNLSR
jgi:hypothetical protein